MARPQNKVELLKAATLNYDKLQEVILSMSDKELDTTFDFSADIKKKEAHWSRDKNLRDVLVHLHEWHNLLMKWTRSNLSEKKSPFLPPPYNWKTYGKLNKVFWENHQLTSLDESKLLLDNSHNKVLLLIQSFSEEELFTKKHFDWTGSTSLGSYCVSATSSHYDWAIKKLRAHIKNLLKQEYCK